MTNRQNFDYLLERYFQNQCTPEEKELLAKMIENADDEQLSSAIEKQWTSYKNTYRPLSPTESDEILAKIFEKAQTATIQPQGKRKRTIFMAAATVALLFFAGWAILYHAEQPSIVHIEKTIANDAQPGTNGAILTLANGRKIILDSAGNTIKKLPRQNGTNISLRDKQLVYHAPDGNDTSLTTYNTLSTPRGKTFQLTLSDGTKIWLNAASSIRYTVPFDAKERQVTVEGEVYFEVAKQLGKNGKTRVPFVVNVHSPQYAAPDAKIEVLGTHFNVNAYPGKDAFRATTTLLEGSVKIFSGKTGETVQIDPGMAATVDYSKNNTIQSEYVNVEDAVSWKNGLFNFHQVDLQTVLMDISRWYNVDIVYEGKIPNRVFWGKMQKSLYLSQVLTALEKMDVHFRIEGNKLYVMP
ncbi:MAG: DUF4974 domain-containing protein [Chitinophagaceae bacterium]